MPLGIRPFAKNMFLFLLTRRAHLGPGSRGGCEHAFDGFTELGKSRGIEHGVPESTAVWRPESPWQLEQQWSAYVNACEPAPRRCAPAGPCTLPAPNAHISVL